VVYVALAGEGDIFTVEGLAGIDRISHELEDIEGVEEVTSVTTTDAVLGDGGWVEVGPLMDSLPETEEEVAGVRQKVRSSGLLRRLVSADHRSALLVADLEDDVLSDPSAQNRIVAAMRDHLATTDLQGWRFMLAGNPVIAEAIERYNTRDQQLFSGLMLLLVGISSFVLLRRLAGALLPLAVVLVTVAWTMGLFVAAGHQTNWVTSIITPILVLVGVADAVHFLSRYQEILPEAGTRREAVIRTLRSIGPPCLLTSLTTAAGFFSLVVNQVMPVRTFGVFAAIGVLLALLATVLILPACLALRPGAPPAGKAPKAPRPWGVLLWADRIVQRRPAPALAVSMLLAAVVALGILRIQVETNLLKYFKPDAQVVTDHDFIEDVYGGSSPLDIVVRSAEQDGVKRPAVLQAAAALQDRFEAHPKMARGVSLADLVQELHEVMSGDPERRSVPDSPQAIAQLLLMVSPETTDGMVDDSAELLRISTRFQGAKMGLGGARGLLDEVQANVDELFPDDVEVRLTGSSVLFVNMDSYLVNGQIRSFGIVLAVLFVVMVLVMRSPRMGLLAMIPNVLPIAFMMGLMGWLGMPLDGFTVMIASIAIGIGVDDTIHYLHHLRHELGQGVPLRDAMSHTMRSVGRALVFTSIVLALGFWVFCLSDFVGTRNFGFLTGITVLVALVADLVVLPAVLLLVGVPKGWGGGRAKGKDAVIVES